MVRWAALTALILRSAAVSWTLLLLFLYQRWSDHPAPLSCGLMGYLTPESTCSSLWTPQCFLLKTTTGVTSVISSRPLPPACDGVIN